MADAELDTFPTAPHQPLIISNMAQLVTDEINVTGLPGKSTLSLQGGKSLFLVAIYVYLATSLDLISLLFLLSILQMQLFKIVNC